MGTRKDPSQPQTNMDRRDFLALATAASAVGLPAGLAVTSGDAALAQPQAATESITRDVERFAKRIDLIRQSLDIPGMSVAVVHRQEVVLARGFGVVDLGKGT